MDALQMKHGDTLGRYCDSEETRSCAMMDALQMKHMETLKIGTMIQKKLGAVLGWMLFKCNIWRHLGWILWFRRNENDLS